MKLLVTANHTHPFTIDSTDPVDAKVYSDIFPSFQGNWNERMMKSLTQTFIDDSTITYTKVE